jgi:hypothetical protein
VLEPISRGVLDRPVKPGDDSRIFGASLAPRNDWFQKRGGLFRRVLRCSERSANPC